MKAIRDRFALLCLLILALIVAAPGEAVAGEFDNWCIPGDGCMGDEPINDNSFSTCESHCVMENPVSVRDLDALLFDVTCKGDWGSRTERMLFARYRESDETKALVLDKYGVRHLVHCQ